MKKIKAVMMSLFTVTLVTVGSLGGVTPNCLGYFYEPKKPDLLK